MTGGGWIDQRTLKRLDRLAGNLLAVIGVSFATALLTYFWVTTYAAAKAQAVPEPDFTQAATYGLRTCPATGCQASTCHAETGEPIPRW